MVRTNHMPALQGRMGGFAILNPRVREQIQGLVQTVTNIISRQNKKNPLSGEVMRNKNQVTLINRE